MIVAYLLVPDVLRERVFKQNPQLWPSTGDNRAFQHYSYSLHLHQQQAYEHESWRSAISVSQGTLSYAGMFLHS